MFTINKHKRTFSAKNLLLLLLFLILFSAAIAQPAQENKIGDISDGSRSTPVHLIPLIDPDSSVVRPTDSPLLPFSPAKTCGPCHDYSKIRSGFHFSAGDSGAAAGRPGQPWIYSDAHSGTQLPLSLRQWPGTFTPEQIGMSNFEYLNRFGRQMPGGSVGDNEDNQSLDKHLRWQVSGKLEINCLSCHDAEAIHDQAEHAAQMQRQNYQWAATASSGFASVEGSAKDMPDFYDIYEGMDPDQPRKKAPTVEYDFSRMNKKNQVFFDLTRKVPADRCYFCHSSKTVDPQRPERWHHDEDVHLKAGMTCVDCHRHGLDHQMVRGYKNEPASANHMAATLTCAGCHIGTDDSDGPVLSGRYGAPKPSHAGIPTVHFEKLACTTCHSGSWPKDEINNVKTSMAHGLGLHTVNRSDEALPHIASPVYVKQENGIIAPHNVVWPSYWAELTADSLKPLPLPTILPVARKVIAHLDTLGHGSWPAIADSQIVAVLDTLKTLNISENEMVYVSGGIVYRINDQKQIYTDGHKDAGFYAWPIAHDVRPAEQSLGIRGCDDCHSTSSPFYFADLNIDTPVQSAGRGHISMNRFQQKNAVAAWLFSVSFIFRPWLKYMILFCTVIIAAVVFLYAFKGLARFTKVLSSNAINNE